jgi:YidC/Oxa1 family membrane protein insertase
MEEQNQRILLAFALAFGVLIVWRILFLKPLPPAPKPPPAAKIAVTPAPQPAAPAPAMPSTLAVQQGRNAEEIVVEGDLYRVTLSTEGAVVKSWVLKKYKDEKGEPLDVVNQAACDQLGYPLGFSLADQALSRKLNGALFVAQSGEPVSGQARGTLKPPVELTFIYSDGQVEARKQFSLGRNYEIHVQASLREGQNYLPVGVVWSGGFGDYSLPFKVREAMAQAVYGSVGNLTKVAQRKVNEDRTIPGPIELAGLEDRYFADIFLPDSPETEFRLARQTWNPKDWTEKEPPKPLLATLINPQPRPLAFRLFVGPKDLDVLRAVRPPLESLVDFGWFTVVAKPLFVALDYIHDHWIHNYGWAIVILTVGINLALFPMKLKSIRSAQEMQRVAPLVKEIQEKYKNYKMNDPRKQRMNEEMMKLYKDHGINPLGGCLPMVVQLPFLYGFYRVLDLSIELRHAPWIGCIRDLAMPDQCHLFGIPLPLLPTVMIVTMFILQKMTPVTSADPAQQRMMMVMPLIFGIMFYNFAAGLVLYWLTGNIVGILQQLAINRWMAPRGSGPPPMRSPQKLPVAKKAVSVKA